jgi:hypothetical protein
VHVFVCSEQSLLLWKGVEYSAMVKNLHEGVLYSSYQPFILWLLVSEMVPYTLQCGQRFEG